MCHLATEASGVTALSVPPHTMRNVMEAVEEIKEQFRLAAKFGQELSAMLEVGKLRHRNANGILRGSMMKVEASTWAERLKVSHGKAGAWARGIPENHDDEEVDEEVASPQLWEKRGNPHGVTTKQMMARYRKEMVELVGDAPENTYELSLRDIVEVPWKEKENKNENEALKDKVENMKKTRNGGVARGENLRNVLLLKMFVRGNMGRRSSFRVNDVHSKVIPKAMATKGEWWTRKELDESSSSDNTNRSSNHTRWRKLNGCLPFLRKAMGK